MYWGDCSGSCFSFYFLNIFFDFFIILSFINMGLYDSEMINFDMGGIIVRNSWKDYCYPFSLVCLTCSFSFYFFSSSFALLTLLSWSGLNHKLRFFPLIFTQVPFLHYKFSVFSKVVLKFTFLLFLQRSFLEQWLIALSGEYWVDLF